VSESQHDPVPVPVARSGDAPPRRRGVAHDRSADHASIARLAERLLPALVAKVTATGLGELEVREGDWRVRVRRPTSVASARRERSRTGHVPGAAIADHARVEHGRADIGRSQDHGRSDHVRAIGEHAFPARDGHGHATGEPDGANHLVPVLSPGVGYARPSASPGTSVRAGDKVGVVDVLGIPQEVVAPVDGLVVEILVEPGEAVEYGEPLLAVEPAARQDA
jgi:biotin carboxyl carrier protein